MPYMLTRAGGAVAVMLVPIVESPELQRFAAENHVSQGEGSAEGRVLPIRLQQLIEC